MRNKILKKIAFGLILTAGFGISNANAAPKKEKPIQKPVLPQKPLDPVGYKLVDSENVIIMETSKGNITIVLEPRIAPLHAMRIKELTREKFYDGLTFHRVIDDFMAQGGDPTGTGAGDSTKPNVQGEFTFKRGADLDVTKAIEANGLLFGWLGFNPIQSQVDMLMSRTKDGKVHAWGIHCPSVASMARAEDPNSANSQFFIMRHGKPFLDRKYSIWGYAIEGLDVVRALKVVEAKDGQPAINPDKMLKVSVLADLPVETRPKVFIEDTKSPQFATRLQDEMTKKGPQFNICEFGPKAIVVK